MPSASADSCRFFGIHFSSVWFGSVHFLSILLCHVKMKLMLIYMTLKRFMLYCYNVT